MAMRKYLGAFNAKPELDKEAVWKHQKNIIAPTIRFLAAHRMSRYFIRRVVNVEKGDPGFYDLVEIYWVDTELEKEYYDFLFGEYKDAGMVPPMVAWTNLIIPVWNTTQDVCDVVEYVDKDNPEFFKTMTGYQIREGEDGDAFWKYLVAERAADIRNIAGDLVQKYTIHRPVAVAAGDPSYLYAIDEVWWTHKEARDEFMTRAQEYKTASGKSLVEDFVSRTVPESEWIAEIETNQLA